MSIESQKHVINAKVQEYISLVLMICALGVIDASMETVRTSVLYAMAKE